jgi:hypothetical protein
MGQIGMSKVQSLQLDTPRLRGWFCQDTLEELKHCLYLVVLRHDHLTVMGMEKACRRIPFAEPHDTAFLLRNRALKGGKA